MTKTPKNRLDAIGGEVPTNGAARGIQIQMPYRVQVELTGTSPLLFHRYNCESVASKSNAKKGSMEKKTDDVESYVWRNEKGEISLPGHYLRGAIVNAARFQQDPRSPRKAATDLYKAAIVSLTEHASLGMKEWSYIDCQRAVVNHGAIPRSRPCFTTGWKAVIILMVLLPEYIYPQLLNNTIQQAGRLIGVGDHRPTYGRFNVTKFEVLKD
jgi:hypothetical protein